MEASVSYSSFADSRVFSARCVTLRLLFAFIHTNHKFHQQSRARPHHWAALDPVSSLWGALVRVSSQKKLPAPQTDKSVEFCQFSECQALLHKRKAPQLKTFRADHWNISENIQSYIKQPDSLLGFNTAQSWKSLLALARLWQVEWTANCSNIGCLVDHTSPSWALLVIRNNAISEISKINSVTAT